MSAIKIHIIQAWSGNTIVTRCGKTGFKSGVTNEFDTAIDDRIHAVPAGTTGEEEPTCLRCLKPKKFNARQHLR